MKKRKQRQAKTTGDDWSIVQVSVYIKRPYQTTRNMMLSGEFGDTKYDEYSHRLTVRASAVRAWRPPTE